MSVGIVVAKNFKRWFMKSGRFWGRYEAHSLGVEVARAGLWGC